MKNDPDRIALELCTQAFIVLVGKNGVIGRRCLFDEPLRMLRSATNTKYNKKYVIL